MEVFRTSKPCKPLSRQITGFWLITSYTEEYIPLLRLFTFLRKLQEVRGGGRSDINSLKLNFRAGDPQNNDFLETPRSKTSTDSNIHRVKVIYKQILNTSSCPAP